MLGIPGELVDATEHLLALADDWRPRRVDLGVVSAGGPEDDHEVADRRCFTFASGLGVDASVVERVDANPRLKARLGAYYFTWVALRTFARRYLVKPPRMEVALADGDTLAGVTTIVQNGSPFTYFQNRPIEIADGTTLDSGSLCGCVLHRATPLSMPSIGLRAFSRRRARHPPPPGHGPVRADRADGALQRRAPAAAAGRRRLPRRGLPGALLDHAGRAERRRLASAAAPRRRA